MSCPSSMKLSSYSAIISTKQQSALHPSNGSQSASSHMSSEVPFPGKLAAAVGAHKLDDASVNKVQVFLHGALQAEGFVAHWTFKGVEASVADHVSLQVLLQWEFFSAILHTYQNGGESN